MPPATRRRWLYLRHHRTWLRLRKPRTFNEKINWRLVKDRRDIIALAGDKEKAKAYARARGVKVARTLWSGTDIREFVATWNLPEEQAWVLKPNFSSGDIIFGQGRPDLSVLVGPATLWLGADRARSSGEWAYGRAERKLIAEERLGAPGASLLDYKFFVFAGEVVTCRVLAVATKKTSGVRYYNADGTPSTYVDPAVPKRPAIELPKNWTGLVSAAEKLGRDYDFVRVDLYDVHGDVYFGELTVYPGGGLSKLDPSMNRDLGAHWRLPTELT